MNTIEKENKVDQILQLVSFRLGNEEFGIDILNVNEILRIMDVTEIPNSPPCVEGVVNVRSKIIPVISTRLKLNMPKEDYNSDTRIIVVEIGSKTVGFIVDEVQEVIRICNDQTEVPPDIAVAGVDSDFITSVAKFDERIVIILDLKKLVNSEEFEIN